MFSKAVCCESLSSVAHFNAQPNTPILLLYPAIAKMAGSEDESYSLLSLTTRRVRQRDPVNGVI